jgi:hypothetical protein
MRSCGIAAIAYPGVGQQEEGDGKYRPYEKAIAIHYALEV